MSATALGCDACEDLFPGVLAAMDTPDGVQRCDQCGIYPGDLEAAAALRDAFAPDGAVMFMVETDTDNDGDQAAVIEWDGSSLPSNVWIASGSNPWVEVDGEPVDWMDFTRELLANDAAGSATAACSWCGAPLTQASVLSPWLDPSGAARCEGTGRLHSAE